MNDLVPSLRLFLPHPPEELREWARSLKYFRFRRGMGGLSGDDGDELLIALRAQTEHELREVLGLLGIPIKRLPPDAPQPRPGVAYTGAQWQTFPTVIHDFPHLQQPSHAWLAGHRVHAWAHGGRLQITISDPATPYEVTRDMVAQARAVEPLLEIVAHKIIDPPSDSALCICPKFYPEMWADEI